MKLFVVFAFYAVLHVEGRSTKGRETDTCIADYLKSKGLVEAAYGSNRPLNPFCTAIVELTKGHILESVRLEVLSDVDMRKESECIMESLKHSDFGNNLLVLYVYETLDGIREEDRAMKMKLAQSKVSHATLNSFMKCQAGKKFGQIFDALFDIDSGSSEEDIDPKEDFCIRQHIIENHLVNPKLALKLNPKGLDTSDIDCNILYPKALEDAEDELVKALLEEDSVEENELKSSLNPDEVSCLLDVIRGGNYINKMLHFDYVKEYDLDHETRMELRGEFIIVMTQLAESAAKCFLSR